MAYLAPALLFVLAFTIYPLGQMIWMSFHDWSLITPPRYVGLGNYQRAFADHQYWVSFVFTLKYTAMITPLLIVGGYLLALLASQPSRLRRFTRTTVFIPVVIGLGVSSLLWYWLFSTDFGLVNRVLLDLGVISKPVLWLGVDADLSNLAIIASVTWKVIGFGMILFVGAIQAIPTEITEASLVDGASYWQRVTRVVLPLTMRTVLLVTLVSIIGSLLAFDQFYIMTAGQPQNETATSVFYVYLNSFPYLRLGYGAALSLILALTILAFTVVQLLLTRRSHA
jgi:multiple sugar transport system permease protein